MRDPDTVFLYDYDFGDDWRHCIRVEEIRRNVNAADVPRLLDGARACPPGDCGGVIGYYELLDAIADPAHDEHAAMRASLGAAYDPATYDVAACRRALGRLRRRTGRTSKAGKSRAARETARDDG